MTPVKPATHRAVRLPGSMGGTDNPLKMSPAIVSGNHLFMTCMTGSAADGTMPSEPEAQFRAAHDKIAAVLGCEGLNFASVVEMTSYHIDIGQHFDLFAQVRAGYVRQPYPAWTAVGVAELRRPGALVEIKVIAQIAAD